MSINNNNSVIVINKVSYWETFDKYLPFLILLTFDDKKKGFFCMEVHTEVVHSLSTSVKRISASITAEEFSIFKIIISGHKL
jgi:hypothetical protein